MIVTLILDPVKEKWQHNVWSNFLTRKQVLKLYVLQVTTCSAQLFFNVVPCIVEVYK